MTLFMKEEFIGNLTKKEVKELKKKQKRLRRSEDIQHRMERFLKDRRKKTTKIRKECKELILKKYNYEI